MNNQSAYEMPVMIKHNHSSRMLHYNSLLKILRDNNLNPDNLSELGAKLAHFKTYFEKIGDAADLFERFLDYQVSNVSSTVANYRSYLNSFLEVSNVFSEEGVLQFIGAEQAKGNSNASINSKLAALRSVAKFAVAKGLFPHNPMALIKPLPVDKSVKDNEKILDAVNLNEVFDKCFSVLRNKKGADWISARNAALMLTLACCGNRIGETMNIKTTDIERLNNATPQYRMLLTSTKGKRDRYVYLPTDYTFVMDEYLEARKQAGIESEWLFINAMENKSGSRQLTTRGARNIINNISGLNPHKFRHYMISYLLSKGANLYDVSVAAGHANPQMTAEYGQQIENAKKRTMEMMNGVI